MQIGRMYPSKFLQPEDLPDDRVTVVTIRGIVALQAIVDEDTGELVARFAIQTYEQRKPFKLNSTNAHAIAKVLGTEETDDWINQRIGLRPATAQVFGELKRVIQVDLARPPSGPALPNAKVDLRPVGQVVADRFMGHLRNFGSDWSAFLRWLKSTHPDMLPLAFGIELADVPRHVMSAMKEYLDSLSVQAQPQPMPTLPAAPVPLEVGSVLDPTTQTMPVGGASGGARGPTPTPPEPPAAQIFDRHNKPVSMVGAPGHDPVTDDDIPF